MKIRTQIQIAVHFVYFIFTHFKLKFFLFLFLLNLAQYKDKFDVGKDKKRLHWTNLSNRDPALKISIQKPGFFFLPGFDD